ncbi:unnamed protein product [Linum trigynum]|uniref:Uncharacterized protein n=1 Tax=Linum trigynum TaxID=586398 RepID=A0AAV2EF15_9ROSI
MVGFVKKEVKLASSSAYTHSAAPLDSSFPRAGICNNPSFRQAPGGAIPAAAERIPTQRKNRTRGSISCRGGGENGRKIHVKALEEDL